MLSAIIGCVWLAIIGEWYFIGFGALLIIASPYLLSILMLPGLAISTALTAYDQYNKYQNEEGLIYNFFNKGSKAI